MTNSMVDTNIKIIENLKQKIKSASKLNLLKESETIKLRSEERSLTEELLNTRNEIEFLIQQMDDVRNQLMETKHQMSLIDICTKSEEKKIELFTNSLKDHKKYYDIWFQKERDIIELRTKKQKEKVAKEEEEIRKQETEITEKYANDAKAVERECEAIEKECIILKKRNNAKMLKLRRMLFETDKAKEIRNRTSETEGELVRMHIFRNT